LQGNLLRVLQEVISSVRRGAHANRGLLRLIAPATNRDLKLEVQRGRFARTL